MRHFTAEAWYKVAGRGDVASVRNDEEYENGKGHLVGEKVLIDGQVYTVKGVEAYCLMTIRRGSPIGLLVAERRSTPPTTVERDSVTASAVKLDK